MAGYRLGVDLGTTYTAAAVSDGTRSEIVPLGDVAAQIPSTVLLREDGTLLYGEAAVQRGVTAPERLAREFKRRMGDSTALLLGGSPMSVPVLTGHLLQYTVNIVVDRYGGPPELLVLTHPANWGGFRLELFQQAVTVAGVGRAEFLPEPAAAAAHFASTSRLDVGGVAAIYDLGGGTFDAAVVRRTAETFDVLGEPQGLEHLGGVDFDGAVLAHVIACAELDPASFDPDDELAMASLDRLRRDCANAKIQLSSDSEVTIPVDVPGTRTTVRLSRGEFEEAVCPAITETVAAFRRALSSARVTPEELQEVVLVGGSARIPLVKEMLTADLQRPVVVSTQPKLCVALGAVMLGTGELSTAEPGAAERRAEHVTGVPSGSTRQGSSRVGGTLGQSTPSDGAVGTATGPPAPRQPSDRHPRPRPPAQRTGSTAATPARAERRPFGADRRTPGLAVAGMAMVAILLALVGPANNGKGGTGSIRVSGQKPTTPVGVDLSKSVGVTGLTGKNARMTLKILGRELAADRQTVRLGRADFRLRGARLLAAGPVHAQITDASAHAFILRPDKRTFLASIPGAGCVLGLLFVVAYVESVLRGMRRRGARRVTDTVALSALGALTGLVLLLTAWGTADRLLALSTVVVVLALTTLAGGLLSWAVSPARRLVDRR